MKNLLLPLVALLLYSCVSYTEVQLTDVAFRDFTTKDGRMKALFDVEIDNPNAFAIRLSKPRLKVFLGNTELKDWSVSPRLKLRRKSKQMYPFYVEISAAQGLMLLPQLLSNPELKIEGTVKAGTFIFGKRIPLSFRERLYQ